MSAKKPVVKLSGRDGNAHAIIAACKKAALNSKWDEGRWNRVKDAMTSGDYDHLIQVAMQHFEVE